MSDMTASDMLGTSRRRRWLWLAAGLCVTLAAALAGWASLHRTAAATAAPQPRHYLNVTACLVTDPRGVTPGSPGAPVWSAMQQASLATRVMVSYLPAIGFANAPTLLSTMAQRQCAVIISSDVPTAQVAEVARAHPRQRFIAVTSGGPGIVMPPNATVVPVASAAERIDQALRALAATA